MNRKFAIAVVSLIIACVLITAGCVSNPAEQQEEKDPVLGTWYLSGTAMPYDEEKGTFFVNLAFADKGTGSAIYSKAMERENGTAYASIESVITETFHWVKNTDNTYTGTFPDGVDVLFTYDAEKNTLTSNFGVYLKVV